MSIHEIISLQGIATDICFLYTFLMRICTSLHHDQIDFVNNHKSGYLVRTSLGRLVGGASYDVNIAYFRMQSSWLSLVSLPTSSQRFMFLSMDTSLLEHKEIPENFLHMKCKAFLCIRNSMILLRVLLT